MSMPRLKFPGTSPPHAWFVAAMRPIFAALVGAVVLMPAQAGAATQITRAVVGSGGAASGGNTSLRWSAGQTTVGYATSATHTVHSGFWVVGGLVPTAVDGEVPLLPSVYQLHQNAPNPFNPRTVIRYELPEDAHVRLKVFDLAGRLVRTMVDSSEPAGRHSARWDGVDNLGRSVSSGIYLYLLETDNYREHKKMTLVQ